MRSFRKLSLDSRSRQSSSRRDLSEGRPWPPRLGMRLSWPLRRDSGCSLSSHNIRNSSHLIQTPESRIFNDYHVDPCWYVQKIGKTARDLDASDNFSNHNTSYHSFQKFVLWVAKCPHTLKHMNRLQSRWMNIQKPIEADGTFLSCFGPHDRAFHSIEAPLTLEITGSPLYAIPVRAKFGDAFLWLIS